MTVLTNPSATISIDGGPALKIRGGQVTEDRSWAPFMQAVLELDEYHGSIPSPITAAKRDVRCVITLSDDSQSDTFKGSLRRVFRSRKTGQITLRVATDEAILQKYIAIDPPTSSVSMYRNMANNLLRNALYPPIPFVTPIMPGAADADITPRYGLTNQMPNPSVTPSLGSFFSIASGTTAIDYSTAVGGMIGGSAVRWTAASAGAESMLSIRAYSAREGQRIAASAFVRSPNSRNYRFRFVWRDADNDIIQTVVGLTWAGSNAWVSNNRPYFEATAPANTAKVGIILERVSGSAGEFSYADGFMVYEVTPEMALTFVDYFDGSTSSTGYTTAWVENAHTSQSVRVPIVERPPSASFWQIGSSAWDYLSSLATVNGLRLFQDRDEQWWLVDSTYSVPYGLTLDESNSTTADEEIDLDGENAPPTGAAVRYLWNDADTDGYRRERFDIAGTIKRMRLVTYERPYPGTGAAAYILAQAGLKAAVPAPITTDMNLAVTPGWGLDIAWDTSGASYTVGAVTFDIGAWQMTVTPRLA